MRISDWSSDVCSSDLKPTDRRRGIGMLSLKANEVALRLHLGTRIGDQSIDLIGDAQHLWVGQHRSAAVGDVGPTDLSGRSRPHCLLAPAHSFLRTRFALPAPSPDTALPNKPSC